MKKEIRTVDSTKNIVRVTTVDERWYVKENRNNITGLPEFLYVPSVTWICDHYPKGIAFYKWLAAKGWDEAESIKTAAGGRGSKVHAAVESLLRGQGVNFDDSFINPNTGDGEELTTEEYEAIISFVSWFNEVKPKIKEIETVVWGNEYAGTIDLNCEIDNVPYIIDFKTSQNIWPSFELQLSAYKHAAQSKYRDHKLAILQLGYRLNKKKFKFTEIEDQYEEFLAAKLIWAKEQKAVIPKQRDLPLSVKLEIKEKINA